MCHSMYFTAAAALFQGYIILAVHTQLQQISPYTLPISSDQIDNVPFCSKVFIINYWK